MKRGTVFACLLFTVSAASAFQLQSTQELGKGEAKYQDVMVKCTTPSGAVSNQNCKIRRAAKCAGGNCDGWQKWHDVKSPGKLYENWRGAAAACCLAKGLR